MTTLSRQGFAGLMILVVALVLMALAAIIPFGWYVANASRLEESQTELRFLEAKLKSAKRAEHAGLTASDNIALLFLDGSTAGLAAASLQSLVGKLASETGMTIERTQPLQSEDQQDSAVVRMEITASGSLENLRNYLLAIEAGEPLIFVNAAKISAPQSSGEDSSALPSDRLVATLQLEARGWRETDAQ